MINLSTLELWTPTHLGINTPMDDVRIHSSSHAGRKRDFLSLVHMNVSKFWVMLKVNINHVDSTAVNFMVQRSNGW